jgi:hypothetical protein
MLWMLVFCQHPSPSLLSCDLTSGVTDDENQRRHKIDYQVAVVE